MEKAKEWNTYEICFEKIFMKKETDKAWLLEFETDLLKKYKFWYPKNLIKVLCESLVISYKLNDDVERKIFYNDKEIFVSTKELISLLDKAKIVLYREASDFYDDVEHIEIYIPDKVEKEVNIDEDLFA